MTTSSQTDAAFRSAVEAVAMDRAIEQLHPDAVLTVMVRPYSAASELRAEMAAHLAP